MKKINPEAYRTICVSLEVVDDDTPTPDVGSIPLEFIFEGGYAKRDPEGNLVEGINIINPTKFVAYLGASIFHLIRSYPGITPETFKEEIVMLAETMLKHAEKLEEIQIPAVIPDTPEGTLTEEQSKALQLTVNAPGFKISKDN